MREYDIAIAGGAMAGATLALALDRLARGRLSIAVVEPFPVDKASHPGFDSRSIALSYGTKQILQSFGLWGNIQPLATPIRHIHVSDRGHAGMTDIHSREHGIDALGYVVELADVGALYHDLLAQSGRIDFLCPESVVGIERQETHNRLTLASGGELSCKLLVAADGAESTCCQLLALHNRCHDFNQVAVIANVGMAEPHDGRAFERFTPSGPLALLPMSDNRMSLVWCLEPAEARRVISLDDATFLDELQAAFGWRLGRFTKVGALASYPLILKQKEQLVSHRFAAVGNAAQLLHPIAGQGFNLGIRDVASLVEGIVASNSGDIGDYSLLHQYQKCRRRDRSRTIDLTAGMVHIFSNEWFCLQLGRNLALMSMDNIPLIKAPLLRRTMGLVER